MPIPRTDNELMVWLNNFANSFAAHAAALGFNEAEVAQVRADASMLSYLVGDLVPIYKAALNTRTSYKALIMNGPVGETGGDPPAVPSVATPPATVAPGVVPRLRRLIQRIQVAPAYTDAIGSDLGITGGETSGPSAPASSAKPKVTATSLAGGGVRVEFNKAGFDGVRVESRRAGELVWQSLGTDNFSPYTDERPPLEAGKPEVREYRLRFVERDEAVGDWSDIVTVTTTP
ncbi:MAG: hypothetical protein ACJ74T_23735 [Pyrinomonadaceae bacterium]